VYRCGIVGVGGSRAWGHAEAYVNVHRGKLAAISTRRRDKLDEFGNHFDIDTKSRYTDYLEMFAKESLDLVHVNTPPNVRLEIMEAAEKANIPAMIIEKPIAIQGEDYLGIRNFSRRSRMKVAVNHQLHFHPDRMMLQERVIKGDIGQIKFIEASAQMNLAYQGTHLIQGISAFNPQGRPTSVFGRVTGTEGLIESPKQHFAPDDCIAIINFDNNISALLRCGKNAPSVGEGGVNTHKRIAIYGSRGFVHWTMWSWEYCIDGNHESGSHFYDQEDILGQGKMTEAIFDWFESDENIHPLNLDDSLIQFSTILAIYMSALNRKVIHLPFIPEPDLISKLRQQLTL
jgi:predicted dehydrogenase